MRLGAFIKEVSDSMLFLWVWGGSGVERGASGAAKEGDVVLCDRVLGAWLLNSLEVSGASLIWHQVSKA